MRWFDRLLRRWALRRRMGEIRRGVWACENDPTQVSTVSQRLGITEEEMWRWLERAEALVIEGRARP